MFICETSVWFEMADSFCEGTLDANAEVRKSLVGKISWGEQMVWCRDADMAYLGM